MYLTFYLRQLSVPKVAIILFQETKTDEIAVITK